MKRVSKPRRSSAAGVGVPDADTPEIGHSEGRNVGQTELVRKKYRGQPMPSEEELDEDYPMSGGAESEDSDEEYEEPPFPQVLAACARVVINLLGAYWDDPEKGPHVQQFYRELMGDVLPQAQLNNQAERDEVIKHIEETGPPRSAPSVESTFADFFYLVTYRVRGLRFEPDDGSRQIKQSEVWVTVSFARGMESIVSQESPGVTALDWRDMAIAFRATFNGKDGYYYYVQLDDIDASVGTEEDDGIEAGEVVGAGNGGNCCVLTVSGSSATRRAVSKYGILGPHEKCDIGRVSVDLSLSWAGPSKEYLQQQRSG